MGVKWSELFFHWAWEGRGGWGWSIVEKRNPKKTSEAKCQEITICIKYCGDFFAKGICEAACCASQCKEDNAQYFWEVKKNDVDISQLYECQTIHGSCKAH